MNGKTNISRFLNIASLKVIGIILIILLTVALLWHGNVNSMQAMPALTAEVYFDGEYRIADGDWTAYTPTSEQPLEIVIHNPHRLGNETAID